jgi:hypothetical protein
LILKEPVDVEFLQYLLLAKETLDPKVPAKQPISGIVLDPVEGVSPPWSQVE